jgi:hypothetical protein
MSKAYKMFIDDERSPPTATEKSWVVVRDYNAFIEAIEKYGCPMFISFDHDLTDNSPTGYDIAHWLVEKDMDTKGNFLPKGFDFYVHSQNPIGAMNIKLLLSNYLEHKKYWCVDSVN